jgi:ribosomal protein S20
MTSNPLRVPKSRRAALAGGAALVLTAAAAHAALAQQAAAGLETADFTAPITDMQQDFVFAVGTGAPDLGKRRDDWLNAVASKLGVSKDKLEQAMNDATKDVGLPPPLIGPIGKIGPGLPGAFNLRIESPFASAAKALNMTEDQLHKELAAGKSLADIAKAHNLDPKAVADAIKTQRKSELDKAVADGVMPKNVADKLKSHIDDEIDHLMQAVPTVGGDGRGVSIHLEWSNPPTP